MKKIFLLLIAVSVWCTPKGKANGWPNDYGGVMLQGFSWDDYTNTRWSVLESQSDELSSYFSLIWVPQSGNCGGLSMGYNPLYYFDQNSSFGTEEALRSMIKTFKTKGTGIIADVVINHRQNVSNWVDFPAETYNGVTYQMVSTDIVADDDNGKCQEWASANGYSLSTNADTGEGWDGMRDLDHASLNVQTCIKAYEDFLLNDLGYTGFRYDVGKGFSSYYIALYNKAASPQFSVGEVWDGISTIKNWIQGTDLDDGEGIRSAAFDFPFRTNVRDAMNGSNMSLLTRESLLSDWVYPRYAITFIENHDTQDRSAVGGDVQDPIKQYIEAANAFLLTMPGTPCVFLPHWLDHKPAIKQMIEARKAAGILNSTSTEVLSSDATACIYRCGKLIAMIGGVKPSLATNHTLVVRGNRYYIYLDNTCEIPWVSLSSAEFEAGTAERAIKLTAVSSHADAQLVYTTDGSLPTASHGNVVASGSTIYIGETTTLQVGLLVDGLVSNIVTRTYTWRSAAQEETADTHSVTVYCMNDFPANWDASSLNLHVWDSNGQRLTTQDWPGESLTETVERSGQQWYQRSFTVSEAEGYSLGVVFSSGSGSPQTVDVTGITSDVYLHITSNIKDGKYEVEDLTAQYAAICTVKEETKVPYPVYDLFGLPVSDMFSRRLVVNNGQLMLLKK